MRHAYLITVHTNWKLLELCLKALDHSNNDFFLLIDSKIKKSLDELINIELSKSQLFEMPRIAIN